MYPIFIFDVELIESWRKLHNYELHGPYSSFNLVSVDKQGGQGGPDM
jgi:hypothetical protein